MATGDIGRTLISRDDSGLQRGGYVISVPKNWASWLQFLRRGDGYTRKVVSGLITAIVGSWASIIVETRHGGSTLRIPDGVEETSAVKRVALY